jgi:hypothetical protein
VVSADGRFIAFESWASDLVANDDNTQKDVFVYDRLRDRISLVSHAAGSENSGNSGSFNPVFAPAGAMVGFISGDSDLVAGDLNESIDVFAAQLDVSLPGDSDGDGLDDAWELAAFSTLDYGPNDDPDGDGSSNLQEFRAGTLPNDAASGFVLHFDGLMALSFKTAPGHTYQLEARQDFSAGSSWQPVGVQIGGDGSINSIQSSNTGAQQYFRIRLIQ